MDYTKFYINTKKGDSDIICNDGGNEDSNGLQKTNKLIYIILQRLKSYHWKCPNIQCLKNGIWKLSHWLIVGIVFDVLLMIQ